MKKISYNKQTVRFTVDFVKKAIIGTKASFAKAGTGTGPIYEELAAKVAAHPDFAIVVKEPKHKSNKPKRTYDGMNFAFMEEYISIQEKNSLRLLVEYKGVKAFAKNNKYSVYPFVKRWFLKVFSTETKPFDMAKALEDIRVARMERACKKANEPDNAADAA